MKRLARLLVVLSAAACGGTGVASAHVDYVTDGPAGSKSFAELLGGVAAAPLNLPPPASSSRFNGAAATPPRSSANDSEPAGVSVT